MLNLKKDIEMEQQIVDKITALIKPENLDHAKILLQKNKGNDSIIIKLENNPWRNGVIKGDMLLCRVKTGGKIQYVQVKKKYSTLFNKMNIKYSNNSSEQNEDMIRIDLSDFTSLIDNPTDDFIKAVNLMYLNGISFPEFGCCSKYKECGPARKCLHIDPLYSTSCQYKKFLQRIGRIKS